MIRSTACVCSFMFCLSFSVMQTDGNRSGALHALRYSGRSPCRCFAPVLIHENGELLLVSFSSISRSPPAGLAIPTGPKVTPLPPVLQLHPECSRAPH